MSKFQKTIQLMHKNEEGKYEKQSFKSAEFIPGSAVEDATDLLMKMSEAKETQEMKDALGGAYAFIADILFEGQFTGEDYRDGMDAREIAPITGELLRSVTAGFDQTYADTKKK